jgi:hypothetical protein
VFLTAAELVDLTGLKRPTRQHAWLVAAGYPVQLDARGRPKVLRAVVEARLGATGATPKAQPNFKALHGT